MKGRPADPAARRGPEVIYSLSAGETEEIGRRLGSHLQGGELLLLVGQLGAGKTVFVKGLAAGLGIDPDEITSPTFVLLAPHAGRLPLCHVDLYRIGSAEEAFGLGIEECLEAGGVAAIEWGEKLPADLRDGAIEVRFEDLGEESRKLTIRLVEAESDD